jgi:hypothetical protein
LVAHFARCGGKVFLFAVIKTKSSATSNAAKSCLEGRTPACSHSAAFGVFMIAKPAGLEGGSVFRQGAPVIATAAAVAFVMFPTLGLAQVNIDQGKSAADIFSNVCTACHKTPRGLAAGKNSLMLSAFLREHYTASGDQASALAAYVLGAGGAEPAPKQKPEVEHARAEEPKAGEPKAAEPKAGEPKAASHPVRAAAKPEEEKRPKQEAKREDHLATRPSAEKHESAPETASREAKPKPADAAHEAAPVSAAPVTAPVANASPNAAEPANSAPKSEATPTASAAVSTEEQPSSGAAVQRDNIPD